MGPNSWPKLFNLKNKNNNKGLVADLFLNINRLRKNAFEH